MMRSRQIVVPTLAALAGLFLSACAATRPAPPEVLEQITEVSTDAPPGAVEQPEAAVPAVAKPVAVVDPEPAALPAKLTAPAVVADIPAKNQDAAELQNEIRRLRQRENASREALDTLKTMMQARAARPQVTYLGNAATGAFSAPAPAVNATLTPPDDAESARERAKLQQDVHQLEGQLATERRQRQELETQLKQLREETAAGPYGDSLNEDLRAARRKVQGLETTLASTQKARDELAAKYEELKNKRSGRTEQDTETQAQIAVLEERQRAALQGLEQELSASQAREHELRQAVTEAEKSEGEVSYALVGDLRAENAALKAKLQEAQHQNAALSGKLKAASRVTDMIFKSRAKDDDSY